MSESRIKRLWKNRISQQLGNLHLHTCIDPTSSIVIDDDYKKPTPTPSRSLPPPPPIPQHHPTETEKKLWRKPLPTGCPAFDFEVSEKTMITEENISLVEKTEIPTRIQSRHYEHIPNLEARLERACKNERTLLLTKLLEKQRHRHCV